MSPWSTPATMSKYSVSPSGDRTFTLVFLKFSRVFYTFLDSIVSSFGGPYRKPFCSQSRPFRFTSIEDVLIDI